VTAQSSERGSRRSVPHPRSIVLRCRQQEPAVRRKDRRVQRRLVAAEDEEQGSRGAVPHPRGLVPGSGEHTFAVGGKRGGPDRRLMST
jgi:hypothetical protein